MPDMDNKASLVAAINLLAAIPLPARKELAQCRRRVTAHWDVINEGGEGYVPTVDWDSRYGREIAQRYGLDIESIIAAERRIDA